MSQKYACVLCNRGQYTETGLWIKRTMFLYIDKRKYFLFPWLSNYATLHLNHDRPIALEFSALNYVAKPNFLTYIFLHSHVL